MALALRPALDDPHVARVHAEGFVAVVRQQAERAVAGGDSEDREGVALCPTAAECLTSTTTLLETKRWAYHAVVWVRLAGGRAAVARVPATRPPVCRR